MTPSAPHPRRTVATRFRRVISTRFEDVVSFCRQLLPVHEPPGAYAEGRYNIRRRCSALGHLSPTAHEAIATTADHVT